MGYPDAAFRGLYAEYSPVVLRLVTVLTGGDCGRAEDLVLLAPSRIRTRLGWAPVSAGSRCWCSRKRRSPWLV
jgi:hypothetical protein